jgi:hypothetical protein
LAVKKRNARLMLPGREVAPWVAVGSKQSGMQRCISLPEVRGDKNARRENVTHRSLTFLTDYNSVRIARLHAPGAARFTPVE